jgi:hypothetical protein
MRTRYLPLVGALVLAVALGGCRAKSGSDGVATASGKTPKSKQSAGPEDVTDKMRKFAACMREHGVDMPDPKVVEGDDGRSGTVFELPEGEQGAPAPDPKKVEAAQKACAQHLPDGGDLPKPDAATVEKMRAFAKCMRENGIENFPDPDDNGLVEIRPDNGFDPRDPKFAEAQKKCEQYGPAGPGGGTVAVPGGARGAGGAGSTGGGGR